MAIGNAVNAQQKGIQMFDGISHWTQGAFPMCNNIGIAYSGGTFTVQGSDGTALSSTNPGYVTLQSKATPGRLVTILVTANQTFTDGSSGGTDNARFGLTTGVNWSSNFPMYLYAVMDDAEALIAFMISRNPAAILSPASTSISKSGSIVNVGQGDFYSLANVTLTSYDSNPCVNLGSFQVQFAGATDSITVQTLTNSDGIGRWNEETLFVMPTGVNGAASGTYFNDVTGTEPTYTTSTVWYTIDRRGMVDFYVNLATINNSPSGAGLSAIVLPYVSSSTNNGNIAYMGSYNVSSGGTKYALVGTINTGSVLLSSLSFSGLTTIFTNATYAANDSMAYQARYKAFP